MILELSTILESGGGPLLLAQAEATGAGGMETASRTIHLIAAMFAVGSIAHKLLALRPAIQVHPAPETVLLARRRWAPITHTVILLLIVTGLYQLMTAGLAKGEADGGYHMWFGMKFLAAMAVFFLMSVLGGRSSLAERLRQKDGRWGTIALLLALAIVVISVQLRENFG
ncbi:MAG: hypothetical protein ACYTGJ_02400 [Planctomycetota bacterium]|jgi:hypothetical protein